MPHDEGHYTPEELLWRAVLVVGLIEATSPRHSMTATRARLDAEEWIASNSDDVYSFVWTCEVLKLSPQATRAAIRALAQSRSPTRRQTLSPTLRNLMAAKKPRKRRK